MNIMEEIKCPKCGSDNVQSYKVIYESGKSTSISSTVGISVGSDWSLGRANTEGISITNLAQTCAPPALTTYNGLVIQTIYIILACCLALIHPIIGIIAGIFLMYKWYKRRKRINLERFRVYAECYDNWEHSYHCNKCGNKFIIDSPDGKYKEYLNSLDKLKNG